jgi:hypothetical protein
VWSDSPEPEAVLPFRPELTWPADMYLEAATSIAVVSELAARRSRTRGSALRQVLTHGFLMTSKAGRCRSRSATHPAAGRHRGQRPKCCVSGWRAATTGKSCASARKLARIVVTEVPQHGAIPDREPMTSIRPSMRFRAIRWRSIASSWEVCRTAQSAHATTRMTTRRCFRR